MRCLKIAIALGVAGLGILVGSNDAQAAIFFDPTYGVYDISTFPMNYTPYNSNNLILERQPWWYDSKQAFAFATDVGNYFNNTINGNGVGPLFAFYDNGIFTYNYVYDQGSISFRPAPNDGLFFYARAGATPIPIPEPSELLGTVVLGFLCLSGKFKCPSLFK